MKRTNNLHKHCKEQLLLLVKESNPHRTAKELELFSTMADDPQNNSTRNLPIHLSDEEFAYWYAYKNNPNDLERLIQSFKVKSMPAYYEPKIEKYKMLMKMTKKVFAEINRFKKDNRPEYDTSAKLVVKKLNNQTRWLIDLALSGDELKKLLAIDSMCPRGLEIIGAKRNAYAKHKIGTRETVELVRLLHGDLDDTFVKFDPNWKPKDAKAYSKSIQKLRDEIQKAWFTDDDPLPAGTKLPNLKDFMDVGL